MLRRCSALRNSETALAACALSASLALTACQNDEVTKPAQVAQSQTAQQQQTEPAKAELPTPHVAPQAATQAGRAAIGEPAPDFELSDVNGKRVTLAEFKGKTVVLEWFNPQCPFVKLSHTKGSLAGFAHERDGKNGVVWLAINSGGEGRQGHGIEVNRTGAKTFGLDHPILLDPSGSVGRAYGATNTPHMFVIDSSGRLAYAGAIDNSPDAEGGSPTGGKLINYVEQALDELAAGKPVSVPKTQAYGCSVKYAGG